MNSAYVTSEVVIAAIALLTVIVGIARWFYKRGGTERGYKDALEQNTEATKELTGVVKSVVSTLNDHDKRLDNHDWRLERLEATPSVNVSVGPTPHRDASPA